MKTTRFFCGVVSSSSLCCRGRGIPFTEGGGRRRQEARGKSGGGRKRGRGGGWKKGRWRRRRGGSSGNPPSSAAGGLSPASAPPPSLPFSRGEVASPLPSIHPKRGTKPLVSPFPIIRLFPFHLGFGVSSILLQQHFQKFPNHQRSPLPPPPSAAEVEKGAETGGGGGGGEPALATRPPSALSPSPSPQQRWRRRRRRSGLGGGRTKGNKGSSNRRRKRGWRGWRGGRWRPSAVAPFFPPRPPSATKCDCDNKRTDDGEPNNEHARRRRETFSSWDGLEISTRIYGYD